LIFASKGMSAPTLCDAFLSAWQTIPCLFLFLTLGCRWSPLTQSDPPPSFWHSLRCVLHWIGNNSRVFTPSPSYTTPSRDPLSSSFPVSFFNRPTSVPTIGLRTRFVFGFSFFYWVFWYSRGRFRGLFSQNGLTPWCVFSFWPNFFYTPEGVESFFDAVISWVVGPVPKCLGRLAAYLL